MIKSRRVSWAGHVVRMGEKCIQDFGGENEKDRTTRKN
jgi:hypothetical protein